MLPPTLARARATLLAVEATTLGLAAGVVLAWTLALALRPSAAMPLLRPCAILATAMATIGCIGTFAARALRIGERHGQGELRRGAATVAVAGALLALAAGALALWGHDVATLPGLAAVLAAAIAATATLALLAWRNLAAIGVSASPLAELLQPSALALLAGFGALLLIGLVGGGLSAELTYELGAGTTMAALWSTMTSGRILRGIRRELNALRADGVTLPPVERSLRYAAITLIAGVLAPALLIVGDLATARLTGIVLAGAALVVVGHPLRYTLCLCRLEAAARAVGPPERAGPQAVETGDAVANQGDPGYVSPLER